MRDSPVFGFLEASSVFSNPSTVENPEKTREKDWIATRKAAYCIPFRMLLLRNAYLDFSAPGILTLAVYIGGLPPMMLREL